MGPQGTRGRTKKGFLQLPSSRLALEMALDLEALVVAAYVFADEYPVPARPGPRVKISDAELVALAVCQAAKRTVSEEAQLERNAR